MAMDVKISRMARKRLKEKKAMKERGKYLFLSLWRERYFLGNLYFKLCRQTIKQRCKHVESIKIRF